MLRSRTSDRFAAGKWSRRPHVGMMVILDGVPGGLDGDGACVWGTMPRNIERALIPLLYEHRDSCANIADLVEHVPIRLRFTATFEPSLKPTYADGFFNRPRKAVLLLDG